MWIMLSNKVEKLFIVHCNDKVICNKACTYLSIVNLFMLLPGAYRSKWLCVSSFLVLVELSMFSFHTCIKELVSEGY